MRKWIWKQKLRILDWLGLYTVLVLISATTFTIKEGVPFFHACYAAGIATVLKTIASKLWHHYFHQKKSPIVKIVCPVCQQEN